LAHIAPILFYGSTTGPNLITDKTLDGKYSAWNERIMIMHNRKTVIKI
jgi:hypothetical protein